MALNVRGITSACITTFDADRRLDETTDPDSLHAVAAIA
jgi:hypothetical protein